MYSDEVIAYKDTKEDSIRLVDDIEKLLNDGFSWCRGVDAKDDLNQPVDPDDERACQWCLSGAIGKLTGAMGDSFEDAVAELGDRIPGDFYRALEDALKKEGDYRYVIAPQYEDMNDDNNENYGGIEAFNDHSEWMNVKELLWRTRGILLTNGDRTKHYDLGHDEVNMTLEPRA